MTDENISEALEFLHTVRGWLVEEIEAPDFNTSLRYLKVANFLRTLLVGRFPVLLETAKALNVDLIVWAPEGIDPTSKYLLAANTAIASWTENPPGCLTKLHPNTPEAFLDLVIHVTSNGKQTVLVTPRAVINWTANKDGPSHLDFKKPKGLKEVRAWTKIQGDMQIDDAPLLRHYLLLIAVWTINAIDHVLRHQEGAPRR